MHVLRIIILVLLILLSVASGVAKIMQMPQELTFFGDAGFSAQAVVLFGVTQLVGATLLIASKTRLWGAVVLALTYLVSAGLVLRSGAVGFALVSMLPVLMCGWVGWPRARGS